MKKKLFLLLTLITLFKNSLGIYPLNLFRFDNILLQPYCTKPCQLDLSFLTEISAHVNGRNGNGDKTNVLKIWNEDQDALAMIRGFSPDSKIGQLAAALNGVNDDGVRGHFNVNGKLEINDFAFIARYYLPKGFYLDLFMPFYFMKLKCIEYEDLTKYVTNQDLLTHELLTDNIKTVLKDLGGLNLAPWEKNGLGDLVLSIWWKNDFPQEKPWLKNVRTYLRAGITIPTGAKNNIDDFASIPFRFGGTGVFLGGDIEVTWGNCIKAGVDLQFLHIFGNHVKTRIKTDENQTDLFLLAKCDAYVDYGLMQEYFIYLQAIRFFKGFSGRLAYNYLFRHEDELYLSNTTYSNTPANTAAYLEDWTIHNFIMMLDYEWKNKNLNGAKLTLFWKQPFNGKRSVQATTVGAQFSYIF